MPRTCPNCTYNLAGLTSPTTCPECGHTLPPPDPYEPRELGIARAGLTLLILALPALAIAAAARTHWPLPAVNAAAQVTLLLTLAGAAALAHLADPPLLRRAALITTALAAVAACLWLATDFAGSIPFAHGARAPLLLRVTPLFLIPRWTLFILAGPVALVTLLSLASAAFQLGLLRAARATRRIAWILGPFAAVLLLTDATLGPFVHEAVEKWSAEVAAAVSTGAPRPPAPALTAELNSFVEILALFTLTLAGATAWSLALYLRTDLTRPPQR